MAYKIDTNLLKKLIESIIKDYQTYAPVKKSGNIVFEQISSSANLEFFPDKTVMSFKKAILPNPSTITNKDKKIAIIGLPPCDTHALNIFYNQFSHTDILPDRKNLFILASECTPSDKCFCSTFNTFKPIGFDLYLQQRKDTLEIIERSKKGAQYLQNLSLKNPLKSPSIIIHQSKDKLNLKNITKLIENRARFDDFWQRLSNNCFGCGACSTVCPLCFCTRQDFKNTIDGESQVCLKWDSCFAKEFSEVQFGFDTRPKNVDRLYNWYHHKFVRAPHSFKEFNCVGCGRCIEACPADLNIKNILHAIIKMGNNKNGS